MIFIIRVILFGFLVIPIVNGNEIMNLKVDCSSECRFYNKMKCPQKNKKVALSIIKEKPSTLKTDIEIYCSVTGTSKTQGKIKFSLAITGENRRLTTVHEKEFALKKNQVFNYTYFTFSNPYQAQSVQVTIGKQQKMYFFNGSPVH